MVFRPANRAAATMTPAGTIGFPDRAIKRTTLQAGLFVGCGSRGKGYFSTKARSIT